MEDLFNKKRQELIKEGLEILYSLEEYTKKNNPDDYERYLYKKNEMINNPKSLEIMTFLNHLKFVKAFRTSNNNYNFFNEIITEVTKYLDNLKPKALPFREDILAIKEAISYIKNIEDIRLDKIK